ncbi:MAG: cell envelope integrity protein CreD [Deltaproteobacteria bacterium]|jgi:inner membrane protein|nr:cell envelope integrity protein CreD [Deltaproteobacteria bacterium]
MEAIFIIIASLICLAVFACLIVGLIWLIKKVEFTAPSSSGILRTLNQPILKRLLGLVVLGLILLWPLDQVKNLVCERQRHFFGVEREIGLSWGGQQTLIGPFIVVPYEIIVAYEVEVEVTENQNQETNNSAISRKTKKTILEDRRVIRHAAILPKTLDVRGRIEPEKRARGIYEVLVYANSLKVSGTFSRPDLKILHERLVEVKWAEAILVVGLTDTRAFRGVSPLSFGQRQWPFEPGVKNAKLVESGFSAAINFDQETEVPFEFAMEIAGSDSFKIATLAEKTVMELASPWPHPSFIGQGLPYKREIGPDGLTGFTGYWSVPNLTRNYPQVMSLENTVVKDKQSPLEEYLVGVALVEPVDLYRCLDRAIKYAILFVGLTILSFFLFELGSRRSNSRRLRIGQYAIIGLALALFYLLLLALAEHIGFTPAYLAASGLIVVMVGGYVFLTLRKIKPALLISLILTYLYGVLYIILNEEDLALLSGAGLLALALVALMIATRNMAVTTIEALPQPLEDQEKPDEI